MIILRLELAIVHFFRGSSSQPSGTKRQKVTASHKKRLKRVPAVAFHETILGRCTSLRCAALEGTHRFPVLWSITRV
jgi:hypothetical protein